MSTPLETFNKHYQYARWFHFIHPVEKKSPVSLMYRRNITPVTMSFPCCLYPVLFLRNQQDAEKLSAEDYLPILIMQSKVEKHKTGERPDHIR